MTVTSEVVGAPARSVAVKRNTRGVDVVTLGAVKVTVVASTTVSATVGPLTCDQLEPVVVPAAVPVSVTIRPELVVALPPAETVIAGAAPASSPPHADSIEAPNTAVAAAEIPPNSVWRRE